MATSKKQRWSILVIAGVMVIGTLGSFAVMVLSMQENQRSSAEYQAANTQYQKEYAEYQKKVEAQANELSAKYFETFKAHSNRVGKFEIESVTSLSTEDLVAGDGETISGSTKFATYYVGWDANGNIFDQSIETAGDKLKAPLSVESGLDNAGLIGGWKEGMIGMKIGGIRLLNIPSDKAYGEKGQTDSSTGEQKIAPNMPLKFVVMAIPLPEAIRQPDMTKLMEAYTKMNN